MLSVRTRPSVRPSVRPQNWKVTMAGFNSMDPSGSPLRCWWTTCSPPRCRCSHPRPTTARTSAPVGVPTCPTRPLAARPSRRCMYVCMCVVCVHYVWCVRVLRAPRAPCRARVCARVRQQQQQQQTRTNRTARNRRPRPKMKHTHTHHIQKRTHAHARTHAQHAQSVNQDITEFSLWET